MATIASLNVALSADTASFHAGMQKAGSSLRSIASAVAPVTVALAAVGYAGSKAFGELSESIARASELVDQASKIHVNTEDLAALRFSAKQSGVEVGALDKSLEMLQRRLGSGDNAAALERIGLSAEKLKGLALNEAFLQIADSLKVVGNEADRAALANEIFGRSGQELTNLINQGSEAIRQQRAEAESLGIVLKDDAAKGLEELGDAQERISMAWEGAWNGMTVALKDWLGAIFDITAEIFTLGDAMTMTFNGTRLALDRANADIRQHQADQKRAKEVAESMAATQQKLNSESANAAAQLKAEAQARTELERATAAQERQMQDAARVQERIQAEITANAKAVFDATRTPQEQLTAQIEELNTLLALGAIDWDTYNRAASDAVRTLADAQQTGLPAAELSPAAPAALEKGSAGALSAVNQSRSDLKRIEDLNRLALIEDQQQTRYLQQIAAAAGVQTQVADF